MLLRASVRSPSRIVLVALILLAGCNSPIVTPPPPTAPTLVWTGTGNPGVPNCTTTQTTACLTTYTLTDTTTGTVISSAISASALSFTLSTLPTTGTHVYQLTINGVDGTGKVVASAPATTAVTIP
jgi:hypothetical protein